MGLLGVSFMLMVAIERPPADGCPGTLDLNTEATATLATLGPDRRLTLGKPLADLPTAVGAHSGAVWVGDSNGSVARWPTNESAQKQSHTGFVTALAGYKGSAWSGARDGRLVAHGPHGDRVLLASGPAVTALAAGPTGMWAGRDDGSVLRVGSDGIVHTIAALQSAISAIAVSGDGVWIGTQRGRLVRLDGEGHTIDEQRPDAAVIALAACADGALLSAHTDRRVIVSDVEIGRLPSTPVAAACDVTRAVATRDGTVSTWGPDGILVHTQRCLGRVRGLAVDDDRTLIAGQPRRPLTATTRFTRWLSAAVQGDLGTSLSTGAPVADALASALPTTFAVQAGALGVLLVMGIGLGVAAGARPEGRTDRIVMAGVIALHATPGFVIALVLLIVFASPRAFGWFPLGGIANPDNASMTQLSALLDRAWHLVLPAIAAAHHGIPRVATLVRTHFVATLQSTAVERIRAAGLPERTVLRHALATALLPVLPLLGNLLPSLIAGSVVVETVFGLPGMGRLAFEAALHGDTPVLLAVTALSGILTSLAAWLADSLAARLDPAVGT